MCTHVCERGIFCRSQELQSVSVNKNRAMAKRTEHKRGQRSRVISVLILKVKVYNIQQGVRAVSSLMLDFILLSNIASYFRTLNLDAMYGSEALPSISYV